MTTYCGPVYTIDMSRPRKNLGKYKKIVYLRDIKGKNFREIGEELKMSRQRVWQIYQRAIDSGMSKPPRNSKIRHITGHDMQINSSSAA